MSRAVTITLRGLLAPILLVISSPAFALSVILTEPADGAVFPAGSTITVSANATPTRQNSPITKVEFIAGCIVGSPGIVHEFPIGSDTTAPYSVLWTDPFFPCSRTYTLLARATDSHGKTAISTARTIRFNDPPSVSLTAPANNAVLNAPATITLTASASDADGTVAKVDFFKGTTLVGTAAAAPYSATVSNLAAGLYSFTAVATDSDGATNASGAVNVTVNSTPGVSITSPTNGATFSTPANIPISISASDADGTISRVEVYASESLITTLTTAPYSFTWTNVPTGTYVLSAKAFDNNDAQTSSGQVTVTVQQQAAALYFIHADHLNTPRLVANSTGATVWRWDQQEPFGNSPADENPSGLGAFDLPLRLPGQYYDKESALHYNMFRDYDPSIGRYAESDPIGLRGGLNTYLYVSADPLAVSDPEGLMGFGGGGAVTYPGRMQPPAPPPTCDGRWVWIRFTRDFGSVFTLNCTCWWSCYSCPPGGDVFPLPNLGQYTSPGKLAYSGSAVQMNKAMRQGDSCQCPKPGPEKGCCK